MDGNVFFRDKYGIVLPGGRILADDKITVEVPAE